MSTHAQHPKTDMKIETTRGAFEIDEGGQGHALLFLHAFPLSRRMWRPQMESLSADFRCVCFSQRGAGATPPHMSTWGIDDLADDVAAVLDAMQIETVALCGLSVGGYIALAFARKYPHRLNALILADTRKEADSPEARVKRDEMITYAQNHSARDVIEKMLPNLVSKNTREHQPQIVQEIIEIASELPREGIIATLHALRDRPDATPQLREIKVPTLVIVGAEDAITSPDVARDLAHEISGARLEIIDLAGHLSNLEQPQKFSEALHRFLAP